MGNRPYLNNRMIFAVAITLFLPSVLFAQMTGETWLKLSDDARIGYTLGLMDATVLYSANLTPSKEFNSMAEELAHCWIKRKITYPILEATITSYVKTHPEDRKQEMKMLTSYALISLCIP